MDSLDIQKLEKILEYKERINQRVQEIIDLLHKEMPYYPPPSDDIEELLLTLQRNHDLQHHAGEIEPEIKKKVAEILHSMSCIGMLWREDKAYQMNEYITSVRHLFELCFQSDSRLQKGLIELSLGYVNSFVLPIHVSRKWASLIELEPLLAKIKIAIRNF